MNTIDEKVNNLIMQEIGLEIGPKHKIYDQDTGGAVSINGIDLVAPNYYSGYGRSAIEFDPYNNRKQMNYLFNYFLEKYSDETGIDAVTYYGVKSGSEESIKCLMSDNTVISSQAYQRDSLKFVDIIMQLNGYDSPELNAYDVPPERKPIKGKSQRRNKNESKNIPNT